MAEFSMLSRDVLGNQKLSEDSLEAFRQSEASVRLEGINPAAYPEYLAMKARVLAGEISPKEAADFLVAERKKTHPNAA